MCTNTVSYPTPSSSIADNPPPPTPTKLQLMHDWPLAFKCNRVIACTKKMFISFFLFFFQPYNWYKNHSFIPIYKSLSVSLAADGQVNENKVVSSQSVSQAVTDLTLLVISAVCPVILKTKISVAHLDGVNQSTLVAWLSALVLFYYCGWKQLFQSCQNLEHASR